MAEEGQCALSLVAAGSADLGDDPTIASAMSSGLPSSAETNLGKLILDFFDQQGQVTDMFGGQAAFTQQEQVMEFSEKMRQWLPQSTTERRAA